MDRRFTQRVERAIAAGKENRQAAAAVARLSGKGGR